MVGGYVTRFDGVVDVVEELEGGGVIMLLIWGEESVLWVGSEVVGRLEEGLRWAVVVVVDIFVVFHWLNLDSW